MKHPKSLSRIFLHLAGGLLTIGLTIKLNFLTLASYYGREYVVGFLTMFYVSALILVILSFFVFKKEVQLVKAKQREKHLRSFIRLLRIENKSREEELMMFKELLNNRQLAEEKLKDVYKQIKDKLELSKIYELPELALFIIEKIINFKEDLNVVLEVQVEGDLSSLERVDTKDLNESINLLLSAIESQLITIPTEDRRGIYMAIKERANHISIVVVYSYMHEKINCGMLNWRMSKLMNKYNGSLVEIHDNDLDSNTLFLNLQIPKSGRKCKII